MQNLQKVRKSLADFDPDFTDYIIKILMNIMNDDDNCVGLNAAFHILKSINPKDSLEVMAAVQLIGNFELNNKIRGYASYGCGSEPMVRITNQSIKLQNAFFNGMSTLKKYKNEPQNINVNKVEVSKGGQAIVGNVTKSDS